MTSTATVQTDAEPPPSSIHVVRINKASDEMDEADRRLAALGCVPMFKRRFTSWSCFSFALSISGLYATIMTTFSYPLVAGGAASIVWCWLIGGAGAMALAVSIAEISSAYPTSGGMYFTIKYLSPPSYIAIVAWIDGWLNLVGTVAGTASAEYGASQMLLSAVSIASGFTYQPTQAHITGVMAMLCVFHGLINTCPTHWLSKITSTYGIVHISILLAVSLALLVVDNNKHTSEYVFTNLETQSGWKPPEFSFFFGCLSVAWIIANADGVGHIAEETKNPSRVIPTAITSAAAFTYIVGFLYNIVLVFTMGDPVVLAATSTGMPVAQIFYNVFGRAPAVLFTLLAFLVMNFVCIPSIHAGSRTIWAFSRDQMLPLSRVWYRMSKRTDTPVPAVWLYVALCASINLIGLGSPVLIAAIFNVCAVALNWSYCIPIICKLLFPARCERGAWNLGRFSRLINLYAVIWNAFLSAIFMLPTRRPVTASNMNYASCVLAFALIFSVAYWYLGGRRYYTGPRTHAHIENGAAVSDELLPAHDPEKGPEGVAPDVGSASTLAGSVEGFVAYHDRAGSDAGFATDGVVTADASPNGETGSSYTGSTVSVDQEPVDVVDAEKIDPGAVRVSREFEKRE
ncbi:hypothetical protein VdG1_07133 [Verticillium dahliae VDG1]|nr:hypothetical protein VdG1_07133 [Verticillium dahliae VDG1]